MAFPRHVRYRAAEFLESPAASARLGLDTDSIGRISWLKTRVQYGTTTAEEARLYQVSCLESLLLIAARVGSMTIAFMSSQTASCVVKLSGTEHLQQARAAKAIPQAGCGASAVCSVTTGARTVHGDKVSESVILAQFTSLAVEPEKVQKNSVVYGQALRRVDNCS